MNLRKVYEYALQREQEGYRLFKHHAESVSHAAVRRIFEKVASEEQTHIAYIESRLASLDGTLDEADTLVFPQTDERFFALESANEILEQTVLESMMPDVAVLRVAYLIEADLAMFYERIAKQAQGAAQQALYALAKWERGHEALFKSLHDRVYEEYTDMPWGG